jgi:hypothetical protein
MFCLSLTENVDIVTFTFSSKFELRISQLWENFNSIICHFICKPISFYLFLLIDRGKLYISHSCHTSITNYNNFEGFSSHLIEPWCYEQVQYKRCDKALNITFHPHKIGRVQWGSHDHSITLSCSMQLVV